VTGYDDKGLDPSYGEALILQKPIDQASLKDVLGSVIGDQAVTADPKAASFASPAITERDNAQTA
jgi:arginine repressor